MALGIGKNTQIAGKQFGETYFLRLRPEIAREGHLMPARSANHVVDDDCRRAEVV